MYDIILPNFAHTFSCQKRKKKRGVIMFSNDILQLIVFLDNLPKSTHEKIIITMQIVLIVCEIIAFLYIKYGLLGDKKYGRNI